MKHFRLNNSIDNTNIPLPPLLDMFAKVSNIQICISKHNMHNSMWLLLFHILLPSSYHSVIWGNREI